MSITNLDGKLDKNHILFRHNDRLYSKNITGDNVIDVFKRNMMDIYLDQFEETIGRVTYDNIIYISVLENRDDTIDDLPRNVKGIYIMSSMCERIILSDQVKENIESINIDKSNIRTFPNISNCNNLKQMRISHSNISEFNINYDLPKSIMELNLSGNNIKNTGNNIFSYDKLLDVSRLGRFKKFNFSDNHLDYDLFPDELARRCNLVRQFTYKHHPITFRDVGRENVANIARQIVELPGLTRPGVSIQLQMLSPQSVHLSSINKSVVDSINNIKKYIKDNSIDVQSIGSNVCSLINKFKNWFTSGADEDLFIYFANNYNLDSIDFLESLFNLETKHSITSLTYKETFELVFAVIKHLITTKKFDKTDLLDRLYIELKDSNGVCFTGKYNRLINVLVGVLDGVQVGISKNEEIQLEFEVLIKRLMKDGSKENFNKILCEAKEVLAHSDDKSTWLDALYDYAPDPEEFKHNGNNWFLTWDDILLDTNRSFVLGALDDEKNIHLF